MTTDNSEFAAALEDFDDGRKQDIRIDELDPETIAAIRRALLLADKVTREPTTAMLDRAIAETDEAEQGDPWYGTIALEDRQAAQCFRAMIRTAQEEIAHAD